MSQTYNAIYIDLTTGQEFYSDRVIQDGVAQYKCVQPTPAYVWVLNHDENTNKFIIKVVDSQQRKIQPKSIEVTDNNTITITFSNPTAGEVLLMLFDAVYLPPSPTPTPTVTSTPSVTATTSITATPTATAAVSPTPTLSTTPTSTPVQITPTPTITPTISISPTTGISGQLKISGTSYNISASLAPIPVGANIGDTLILAVVNGNPNAVLPSSFTPIYAGAYGQVGTKIYTSDDVNGFELGVASFYSITSIASTTGSVSLENSSFVGPVQNTAITQNAPITPQNINDLAVMIFINSDAANIAPPPSYTILLPYNLNGQGACGISASWTYPNTLGVFAGDTVGLYAAGPTYPGAAIMLMFSPSAPVTPSPTPTISQTPSLTSSVTPTVTQTVTPTISITPTSSSSATTYTHRYWRINLESNNGAPDYSTIAELQFYNDLTNPVNLIDYSLGGIYANASSYANGSNTPADAFDGDTLTKWTAVTGGGFPQWLSWDFQTPTFVAAVGIIGNYVTGDQASYAPQSFDIQYSDDNSTWTTANTITGQTNWGAAELRMFGVNPNTNPYPTPTPSITASVTPTSTLPPSGSGNAGIVSSVQVTPIGSTGLTQIESGSTDDGYINIGALPFDFYYNGVNYGNGLNNGIFVGSNGYVTFGFGSEAYSGIGPTNPGLAMLIQGADNSYQQIFSGAENNGNTYRLRYEGNGATSGTVGSPGIFWELTFYRNQKMQLVMGSVNRTGACGLSNGTVYIDNYAPTAYAANTSYAISDNAGDYGTGLAWTVGTGSISYGYPISSPPASPTPSPTPSVSLSTGYTPSTAYWRINITAVDSDPTPVCAIAELQFKGSTGGPNLCVGGTPIASSYYTNSSTYSYVNAFDNDPSSCWASAPGLPSWLGYTFANPVSIVEVSIQSRVDFNGQSPVAFDLQFSLDNGNSWSTLWSATTTNGWALGETRVFDSSLPYTPTPSPSASQTPTPTPTPSPSTSTYSSSTTYNAAVLADSPTSYYRLNETTGTVVTDAISGNNATLSVDASNVAVPGLITGDSDTAYSLSTGQYFTVPNLFSTVPANWGLEFVVKPLSVPTQSSIGCIFQLGGYVNHPPELDIEDNANGTFVFRLMASASGPLFTSTQAWAYGTKLHVFITYDSSKNINLYVNGVSIYTGNYDFTNSFASSWTFGSFDFTSGGGGFQYPLDGILDEVAIYQTLVTPERIAYHALLSNGPAVTPTPSVTQSMTPTP